MAYSDISEVQTLIGWIKPPVEKTTTQTTQTTTSQNNNDIKRRTNMYGSFVFTVKEGDNEFTKGAVFLYNAATNTVTGFRNIDQLHYVNDRYKKAYGTDFPSENYSTIAPVYRHIFAGLRTDTTYDGDKTGDIKKLLDQINSKVSGAETAVTQIKTLVDSQLKNVTSELAQLASQVKGNDIAQKQTFTALYDINIRKEAGIRGEKVGVLRKGQTVDIVGSANSDGYYWISFMNNGSLAYVCSKVEGGEVYGNIV